MGGERLSFAHKSIGVYPNSLLLHALTTIALWSCNAVRISAALSLGLLFALETGSNISALGFYLGYLAAGLFIAKVATETGLIDSSFLWVAVQHAACLVAAGYAVGVLVTGGDRHLFPMGAGALSGIFILHMARLINPGPDACIFALNLMKLPSAPGGRIQLITCCCDAAEDLMRRRLKGVAPLQPALETYRRGLIFGLRSSLLLTEEHSADARDWSRIHLDRIFDIGSSHGAFLKDQDLIDP